MPDLVLAERPPLAHRIVPGRHGRADGEPGVLLGARTGLGLHMLLARSSTGPDLRHAAAAAGAELPAAGCVATAISFAVLWAGPEQWLVASEPDGRAAADRFVATCRPFCGVVDQSDARAIMCVAGPEARACLAKGFPIDLHPRVFGPGRTALTIVAGVAVQIWQTNATPTYLIAAPRSLAEGFWAWLTEAAAEYGTLIDDN